MDYIVKVEFQLIGKGKDKNFPHSPKPGKCPSIDDVIATRDQWIEDLIARNPGEFFSVLTYVTDCNDIVEVL